MRVFIIVISLFVQLVLCAQSTQTLQPKNNAPQSNPLLMNGYVGASIFIPTISHKGFEAPNLFQGVEGNFGVMNFSMVKGTVRKSGNDSSMANIPAAIYKIGARLGKDLYAGNNSFTSFGIKPFFQISGSVAQMPNKLTNNGTVQSIGLVLSPGVHIKCSHLYLAASYDAGLYLNSVFWGNNSQHNLAKGFIGGARITVGLDNAYDLLTPKEFTMDGFNVRKQIYKDISDPKYDVLKREYYREVVTTTITKTTPAQRTLQLIAPFWGIGPSYSFFPRTTSQASNSLIGINTGVRFWYLMVDGFYEQGTLGTESQVNINDITVTYPQLRNYDFSTQINATQYGAKIGYNVSKLIAMLNFRANDAAEKKQAKRAVTFVRLHAVFTMGVANFNSTAKYTYSDGESRLLDFQQKNSITPDGNNNAKYLPKQAIFKGFGGNLEIGCVNFSAIKYKYDNAQVANHWCFNVSSNIPIARLVRSLKVKHGK